MSQTPTDAPAPKTDAKPKPVYVKPEVTSAKIYERLCLRCLKRVGVCVVPNVRS